MTLITPPPPAPNRADPATFPDRADAYVAWWATVASELNGVEVYGRTNIVGTVSESSGVPTGAIIQTASNANGRYIRYADGTQICTHQLSPSDSANTTWTYPIAFSATPQVFGNSTNETLAIVICTFSISTTSAQFNARLGSNNNRTTSSTRLLAVGRWF
jgi:hypothetical protein